MKLYWRYKKDGKWTWKAADKYGVTSDGMIAVYPASYYQEEEE